MDGQEASLPTDPALAVRRGRDAAEKRANEGKGRVQRAAARRAPPSRGRAVPHADAKLRPAPLTVTSNAPRPLPRTTSASCATSSPRMSRHTWGAENRTRTGGSQSDGGGTQRVSPRQAGGLANSAGAACRARLAWREAVHEILQIVPLYGTILESGSDRPAQNAGTGPGILSRTPSSSMDSRAAAATPSPTARPPRARPPRADPDANEGAALRVPLAVQTPPGAIDARLQVRSGCGTGGGCTLPVHSARCRTRAAAHVPTLLRCLTRRSPVQALKSQRASTQAAPVDAAGTRLPSQVAPPLPPPRLRAPCDVHRALRAPACTQPPSLTECRCYRSRARRPSFVPHRLLPLSLSPRRPQEMSCSDPGAVAHGPCLHRRSVDHPVHLRQNLRGPRQTARSSMNGRSAQTTRLLPCWQLSGSSVGRTRRL